MALRFLPQLTLGGFCPFSDTVCLTYRCAGGVSWSATLPFCYRCFSCTGWLASVRWVLHPVSESSLRRCDCSLIDSIVVLFGLYLPPGFLFVVLSSPPAVLDFCGGCAVPCLLSLALGWMYFWPAVFSGASSLRSLQSRLPFMVCPPCLFLSFTCSCGGLGGHRSVSPPAVPVCGALVGSLLRRSVALAYCCTLSFCCSSPGFLPLVFIRTWVGWLRSCRGSCLLFLGGGGELSYPCPGGFRLAVPTVWLSRLLACS